MRIGTVGGIGTVGRAGPGRATPSGDGPCAAGVAAPAGRALAVIDGGRREEAVRAGSVLPRAAFLTQLIAAADPDLRPSRLERTRIAASRYAQAALGGV